MSKRKMWKGWMGAGQLGLLLSVAVGLVGCSKATTTTAPTATKPVDVKERVSSEPEFFSFADTNVVVTRSEIVQGKVDSVEFDFNNDGKNDLVVSDPVAESAPETKEKTEPAVPRVSVYIQRTAGDYFLGGVIQEPISGQVIGLAHRKGRKLQDLFVIYRYADGQTEMVRYQNEGAGFMRIKEGVQINEINSKQPANP